MQIPTLRPSHTQRLEQGFKQVELGWLGHLQPVPPPLQVSRTKAPLTYTSAGGGLGAGRIPQPPPHTKPVVFGGERNVVNRGSSFEGEAQP